MRPEVFVTRTIPQHLGSTSIATRTKMVAMAATNLAAGLNGKVTPNL